MKVKNVDPRMLHFLNKLCVQKLVKEWLGATVSQTRAKHNDVKARESHQNKSMDSLSLPFLKLSEIEPYLIARSILGGMFKRRTVLKATGIICLHLNFNL